jgi:hypothetical protein
MQNLKRGSFLRKAIMAPPGFELVVGDLSQIEPRVLSWLAGDAAMLDVFRSGEDPYAVFGARMFNIPGLSKDSHPLLRQSAKSALLGCGYGMGWASFAGQLLTGFLGAPPLRYDKPFARQLGVTGETVSKFLAWDENITRLSEIPHTCSQEELIIHCLATKAIVEKYRLWANCWRPATWSFVILAYKQPPKTCRAGRRSPQRSLPRSPLSKSPSSASTPNFLTPIFRSLKRYAMPVGHMVLMCASAG